MTVTASDLSGLAQISKPAIAWPFSVWPARDLLTQYGRVTRSVPLKIETAMTSDQVADCYAAVTANANVGCCLTIQAYDEMRDSSGVKIDDANVWNTRCTNFITMLSTKLAALGTLAQYVEHAIIDIEHWRAATWAAGNYTAENPDSYAAKRQIVIDSMATYCPNAELVWFGKGDVQPNPGSSSGYHTVDLYPTDMAGANVPGLYYEEWEENRTIFAKVAAQKPYRPTVPFVALNRTKRRSATTAGAWAALASPPPDDTWLFNAGFETCYAGAAQTPSQFPLSACPYVGLYHEESPASNAWLDQLLTFHKGAVNTP